MTNFKALLACVTVWPSIVSVPRALSSHLTPSRSELFEGRQRTVIRFAKLLLSVHSNNLLCPLDFCRSTKPLNFVDVQMYKHCILFTLSSILATAYFFKSEQYFSLSASFWCLWSEFLSERKLPWNLTRLRVHLGLVNSSTLVERQLVRWNVFVKTENEYKIQRYNKTTIRKYVYLIRQCISTVIQRWNTLNLTKLLGPSP